MTIHIFQDLMHFPPFGAYGSPSLDNQDLDQTLRTRDHVI